ncbi:MAG: GNAT family N-acetyltransferase [Deltaproteobacteria bacterium]|nr:GNAT family N-acetyltransferase [Deltaproteobacteria bacterium]
MKWRIKRMQEHYQQHLSTVDHVFRKLKPGRRIFIGTGCAEPQFLVKNLANHRSNLADAEFLHLISLNISPLTDSRFREMFRLNTFFIGRAARDAVGRGDADYTPIFLSEIPKIIKTGRLHIDVAMVQVSPPDPFGNCSLGVSVECVKAAVEHADHVIAQINPRMPKTHGDSIVSVDQFDAIIEHEEQILEYTDKVPDDVANKIGFYVSRLVPNGATIQAGIGSIPNAVLNHLMDKRDLGIHTEMFSDGILDLYEAGVITNRRKTFHPGKIVAAFCLGSQRLYDMIDDNPVFEFYPTDYVSDPRNIAKNDNMVAINSALEIDLTGQVCADSLGHQFYSGIGGQADFIRGAALARNGRPIIAIPSTARNGEISRIVPVLAPGAGVVTTRGDVHYVVTEHGIAYLHGKNIRERAMALIKVAHPKFRPWLLEEAKKLTYVYHDQQLPKLGSEEPERYRWTYQLPDETTVSLRPINYTDEDRLRHFFYNLGEQDVYYRFMGTVRTMEHKKAQPLVVLDYDERFAIAGYVGHEGDEDFVCVGRWFLDRATNMAEVAFTVLPQWQTKGIGTFLLKTLIDVAKEKGILGFTADVLKENSKMLRVFFKSGYNVTSQLEDGVYSISFLFSDQE